MSLVIRTDKDTKIEVERRCCDGEIVGRNEPALAMQSRKQVRPVPGNLGSELHDRDPRDESVDLGATTCRD
jgi:hypothetical protein